MEFSAGYIDEVRFILDQKQNLLLLAKRNLDLFGQVIQVSAAVLQFPCSCGNTPCVTVLIDKKKYSSNLPNPTVTWFNV